MLDMCKIDVIELMQRHGVRPTSNRIIIAESLASQNRPVSLMELEQEIESIDKSGIFRTLALFREKHMVHTIEDGGDAVRYELCRSSNDDHDDDMHVHFYCESCHKTFCLEDTAVPQVQLPEGYIKESVNYMVKGICPSCLKTVSG